jgi:methionyl-tRNA formyltransferase
MYEGHEVVGVVTQPDRPKGRGRRMAPSPVKNLAVEEGLPVLTPERPRGPAFEEQVRALNPDLSVVVAYGHILRPEILAIPPAGAVNVHASMLPELRGAAPVNWAILRGMKTTGVTIMRMEEGLDTGPVIFQTPEEIGPTETATELGTRLSEVGAEALIEALALLEAGVAEEREQDHARATYAPKIDREMARIDWSRDSRSLSWHLRGLDAVPGAWTTLHGEPIKLFGPTPEPSMPHGSPPGTVLAAAPGEGLLVACGTGALRMGEIHPPGGRRMRVDAWIRGHGLPDGVRFE